MGNAGGGSIPDGLNVKANHDDIVRNFETPHPQGEGDAGAERDHVSLATGEG